jgi:RluA family pseudouridine synthase
LNTKCPVIFEDEWLLIINKPAGLVVHVNPGDEALGRENLQSILESERARKLTLFHRLDRDTTGLVMLGKRTEINAAMSEAFEKKRVRKSYFAVVSGEWRPEWNKTENFLARLPDGGWTNQDARLSEADKAAVTTFRLLKTNSQRSWIEAIPKTGRTHQIRLHCQGRSSPILGDRLYNPRVEVDSPPHALHAYRLDFTHPVTKEKQRVFAPPPAYWLDHWLVGLDDGKRLHSILTPS